MHALTLLLSLFAALPASAQIDPSKRQLVQLGWDQSVARTGTGYAFLYMNRPETYYKGITLRLVVAPVYADSEFGLSRIAPLTDLGVGLAGGGFAYGHNEIRMGVPIKAESFEGHGLSVTMGLFRLLNPGKMIPLQLYLRGTTSVQAYKSRDTTDPNFVVPLDIHEHAVRLGLRFGGREPQLGKNALELSTWYQARVRSREVQFGYGDRTLRQNSHFFWSTGHFAYTFPQSGRYLSATTTLGQSVNADRLNAWRLGGALPMVSEFPISLPGYSHQELTARNFGHFEGRTLFPLDRERHIGVGCWGAASSVDYLPGFEQPGSFNSGIGFWSQVDFPNLGTRIGLQYGYGFQAIRKNERGAHSVGATVQVNLGGVDMRLPFEPSAPSERPRGYGTLRGSPKLLP